MPTTLGSNIASLRGQRQLARTSAELGTAFERLSSGQRINRASDDAAGLAIADSLNARSRIFNQGVRNLNDGLSLLTIADSAIANLTDIMIRLEELAAQAANGVYTNKQRKALDAEAQALSKELFRISKATEFNGQRLLSGEFDAVNLQAGVGENAVLSAGVGGAIGTGSFNPFTSFSAGLSVREVVAADFNGDGVLDLATSGTGTGVSILLGLGNGSFSAGVSYATAAGGFGSLVAADFNGDGALDLARAGSGSFSVLLGLGNGTFGSATSYLVQGGVTVSIAAGDFDGDGVPDVVATNYQGDSASIFLGLGNGSFDTQTSFSAGNGPQDVVVGDFNRDGLLDFVTGNTGEGTVRVFLGLGNGTFGPSTSFSGGGGLSPGYAVASGDFNGDGVLDVVLGHEFNNRVSVLLGTGDGSFGAATTYLSGAGGGDTRSVATGDLNGDGFDDIILGPNGAAASVLLSLGNGSFASGTSYTTTSGIYGVVAGDFDGDGVLDFAVGKNSEASVHVFSAVTKDGVAPLLPFTLETLADAHQALPVFKRKREQLTGQRGQIGAFQSRIDVARNVLEVSSENFKAAESRIRDADIAEESSRLVRLSILQQASSAILAQANQQPTLVFQLLQG